MKFSALLVALERRGRPIEAQIHLAKVSGLLAARGISVMRGLEMEVGDLFALLDQPPPSPQLPGWDETTWGPGFVVDGKPRESPEE